MLPGESERELGFTLDDLVYHILFGAERRSCKRRDCRKAGRDIFYESFVVSSDTELRGRFGRKDWGRDALEPVMGNVSPSVLNTSKESWPMPSERNEFANHPVAMPQQHSHWSVWLRL